MRSDVWWSLADEADASAPLPPPTPADVASVARLRRTLAEHEARWRELFASGELAPPLELVYEELAERYEATVRRTLALLGSPASEIPAPRLRRQADASTEAWVAACAAACSDAVALEALA